MFVTSIKSGTVAPATTSSESFLSVEEIVRELALKTPEQVAIIQAIKGKKTEIIIWQGGSLPTVDSPSIRFEKGKINTPESQYLLPYFTERKVMQKENKDYLTLKLTDLYSDLDRDKNIFEKTKQYNQISFGGNNPHKVESMLVLPKLIPVSSLEPIAPEEMVRRLQPYVVQKSKPISGRFSNWNNYAWADYCRGQSNYEVVLMLVREKGSEVIQEAVGAVTAINTVGGNARIILHSPYPDEKNEGNLEALNFKVRTRKVNIAGGTTPEAEHIHMRYLSAFSNQNHSMEIVIDGQGAEYDVLSIDPTGYYFKTDRLTDSLGDQLSFLHKFKS